MSYNIKQTSFAAGELSSDGAERSDLSKHAVGAKKLHNFYVHPVGSASNRCGTRMMCETKGKSRILPFVFSGTDSFVLEFAEGFIRVLKNKKLIHEIDTFSEYHIKYKESELPLLKIIQSADTIFITHEKHPITTLKRLKRDGTQWEMKKLAFENGPFRTPNIDENNKITAFIQKDLHLRAEKDTWQEKHVGALWQLTYYCQGESISTALDTPIRGTDRWILTTRGSGEGSVDVMISYDNGKVWEKLRSCSSAVVDSDVINKDRIKRSTPMLKITNKKGDFGFVFTTTPYVVQGHVIIKNWLSAKEVTAYTLSSIEIDKETDCWAEGAWNDVNGYPACCCFYDNRFCAAGTTKDPQTIWASVTNDYNNFGTSLINIPTDAITIPLVGRKVNKIHSMTDNGDLLAFTEGGIWMISSKDGLSATDIATKSQSYVGAHIVDPTVINDMVLFVQSSGNIVRDMAYKYDVNKYTGNDLTILAKHLFEKHQLTDWSYQPSTSVLWCVRDDGVLLGLTYLKEQDVWAWHHHSTQGKFESVCCVPTEYGDEVYFIVNRDDKRYIEVMGSRTHKIMPNGTDMQFYLDAATIYSGKAINEVTGLNYLEGKTVSIVADGFVLDPVKVKNGKIILPDKYANIVIGLPYIAEIEMLQVEMTTKTGGDLTAHSKCIEYAVIGFRDTQAALVGVDNNNMYEVDFWDNKVYGEATKPFTGRKDITLMFGHDPLGSMFIRQEQPLPITVNMVLRGVDLGGR